VLGVTAVPLREMVCGLPAALSVIATVPVTLPVVLGTSVTLMAQLAPAASVVPQLVVSAKFALTAIPLIDSGAVPVLVSVMSRGSLVEPTSSSPKVRLLAEKEMLGDPPFPQLLSAQDPNSIPAIKTKNLDFMFSSSIGGVGSLPATATGELLTGSNTTLLCRQRERNTRTSGANLRVVDPMMRVPCWRLPRSPVGRTNRLLQPCM
jgi:hypothetical protein